MVKDYYGKTLLMYACEKGKVELVRELIKKGVDLEKTDSDGDDVLDYALVDYEEHSKKSLEVIKLLIDAGIKLNYDEDYRNPVNYAVYHTDFELVKLLIEAGAKPNTSGNFHTDTLSCSLQRSYAFESSKYLIEVCKVPIVNKHLLTACNSQQNLEVIKLLIEKGCDINHIDLNGYTPLIEAGKSYGVVKFLLEQGANPNLSKSTEGMSALMYAIRDGEPKTVELLIKYGAKVNDRASDRDNWTPLMYAARYCQKTKTLELLLNAGAEINATEYYGWTSLMLAAANSTNAQTVQLLIKRGADLNAVCRAGKTALIHCCESMGNVKVIKALLEAGAEVNIQDNDENTAFDMAVKNGNWEAVKLLKLYDAGQINAGYVFKDIKNMGFLKLTKNPDKSSSTKPEPQIFKVIVRD